MPPTPNLETSCFLSKHMKYSSTKVKSNQNWSGDPRTHSAWRLLLSPQQNHGKFVWSTPEKLQILHPHMSSFTSLKLGHAKMLVYANIELFREGRHHPHGTWCRNTCNSHHNLTKLHESIPFVLFLLPARIKINQDWFGGLRLHSASCLLPYPHQNHAKLVWSTPA